MKWDLSDIAEVVKSCYSVDAVLRHYGMPLSGGNRETVKRRISANKADTSHFTGQGHRKGSTIHVFEKAELKDILIENSTYRNTHRLKLKLIEEGIKLKCCEICKNSYWQGNPIPLELHHKNGVNTDHRIENLEVICPNCHAMTDTYRAKNI
jgi:hypothetical protein